MCHYYRYRYILSPATVYADDNIRWRQFVQHVLSPATIYAGDNICRNNMVQGQQVGPLNQHCAKKPVTTMLTYPWKCTVLHCHHLGNTWKPLVLMTRHFDSARAIIKVSGHQHQWFPGGYNVKLYVSRGRLAWWLLAFLHSASTSIRTVMQTILHSGVVYGKQGRKKLVGQLYFAVQGHCM